MAEQTQLLTVMPPLPLQMVDTSPVRPGAFCEPEDHPAGEAIRLTSGTGSLRLKPVHGGVGLHAIQNPASPESASAKPASVTSASEVSGESGNAAELPSQAQSKLARQVQEDALETDVIAHAHGRPEAEATSVEKAVVNKPVTQTTRSSIVLIAPVNKDSAASASTPSDQTAKILVPAPTIRRALPLPVPVRPEADSTKEQPQEDVSTDPIVFSLSDRPEQEADHASPTEAAVTTKESSQSLKSGASAQGLRKLADVDVRIDDSEEDALVLPHVPLPIDPLQATEPANKPKLAVDSDQPTAARPALDALPSLAATNELPQPLEQKDLESNVAETGKSLTSPASQSEESFPFSSLLKNESIEVAVVEPFVVDTMQQPSGKRDEARVLEKPAHSRESSDLVKRSNRSSGPVAINHAEPPTIIAGPSDGDAFHQQHYRPPVAVTPVPITYQRSEARIDVAGAEAKPTVEPVAEMNLTVPKPKPFVESHIKLTPLYMKSAQVRSLTIAGDLRDVRVADTSICQAVTAGPNQLKLIGTGDGVTQLVVWAETDDPNRPLRMRAFEIHVDRVDPAVEEGGRTSVLLNESIRKAFPNCRIVLSQEGGELIVSGRCDNAESAEKIIRMIRKTCLVPVQDRLIVR